MSPSGQKLSKSDLRHSTARLAAHQVVIDERGRIVRERQSEDRRMEGVTSWAQQRSRRRRR